MQEPVRSSWLKLGSFRFFPLFCSVSRNETWWGPAGSSPPVVVPPAGGLREWCFVHQKWWGPCRPCYDSPRSIKWWAQILSIRMSTVPTWFRMTGKSRTVFKHESKHESKHVSRYPIPIDLGFWNCRGAWAFAGGAVQHLKLQFATLPSLMLHPIISGFVSQCVTFRLFTLPY